MKHETLLITVVDFTMIDFKVNVQYYSISHYQLFRYSFQTKLYLLLKQLHLSPHPF
jgi:hypothetical protein